MLHMTWEFCVFFVFLFLQKTWCGVKSRMELLQNKIFIEFELKLKNTKMGHWDPFCKRFMFTWLKSSEDLFCFIVILIIPDG